MSKRKHSLLKNEIEMLKSILLEKVYPTWEYKLKLVDNLDKLKKKWYKSKC